VIKLQAPSQIINNDETITVVREGKTKYVDGKKSKGPSVQFEILGNIQPLDGRELLLVPEGDRFKEQYNIWTDQEMLVNDRVVRCGANFQVQTVEVWGSFFQARIMRIDVGQNATP
jgi:hypothetical protein